MKWMNKRILFSLWGMILGIVFAGSIGGRFISPEPVSKEWSIRSPAQDELAGIPQIGQGISISDGRLRIHQQQLYPSDTLIRKGVSLLGTFSGELDPKSGVLVVGLLGETEEYVFLRPQFLYTDTPDGEGIPLLHHQFSFSITKEGVYLEPQKHLLVGLSQGV